MIHLKASLFLEIATIYLVMFLQTTLSSIQCFDYNSTQSDILNNTIKCPDPADSCFTVKREDGLLMVRSCIWEGHCTERTICGIKAACQLHCCHTPLCNSTSRVSTTPIYRVVFLLGLFLILVLII